MGTKSNGQTPRCVHTEADDARTREEVDQLRNLRAHLPGGHCKAGAQCPRFRGFLALTKAVGLLAQAGR